MALTNKDEDADRVAAARKWSKERFGSHKLRFDADLNAFEVVTLP